MGNASVRRAKVDWQLRTRAMTLGEKTRVMGIVNITPDSFSDGGLYLDADRAVEHALRLLEEGADLVDLGAESTRPGSAAGDRGQLSSEEEQARLLPVINGVLKTRPDAVISVDTYKSTTARAAVAAGAEIVNDVSGFGWDAAMAGACSDLCCGVVLMHTRGTPAEWKTQERLPGEAILPMVLDGLTITLNKAAKAEIEEARIVLDPGYGFGKRGEENYSLLARQAELLALRRPLLAGLSRKSFLTRASGSKAEQARDTVSIAGMTAAILQGASIVRVHAVKPAVEAAAVADALLQAGLGAGLGAGLDASLDAS